MVGWQHRLDGQELEQAQGEGEAVMKKVAFICVHNSCRSQIAEALGKKLASDVFESYSAGPLITYTKTPGC